MRCKLCSDEVNRYRKLSCLHNEEQNTTCDAWKRLEDRIEEAAHNKVVEFIPFKDLSWQQRRDVITLPASIAKLKHLRSLTLYRTNIVRLPPEIGELKSLQYLSLYTSWRLHWVPYEITKCRELTDTSFSTRMLYGNYKFRTPFPHLRQKENREVYHLTTPKQCSICNAELNPKYVKRRWLSRAVGTDVLPLLVNACSLDCIAKLPSAASRYVQEPHIGGHHIKQPPASFC